jgi:hypothetical protein
VQQEAQAGEADGPAAMADPEPTGAA